MTKILKSGALLKF